MKSGFTHRVLLPGVRRFAEDADLRTIEALGRQRTAETRGAAPLIAGYIPARAEELHNLMLKFCTGMAERLCKTKNLKVLYSSSVACTYFAKLGFLKVSGHKEAS